MPLTDDERALAAALPQGLNAGEGEAIALCQQRRLPLLSNDRRAVRYCQMNGIEAVDLPTILRLLWTRQVAPRTVVEQVITRKEQVERLVLSETQRDAIFAFHRQ